MSGHADCILPWVQQHGAELHLEDKDGMTALHHAANAGQAQCIAPLIQAGSMPNKALPTSTSLVPGATPLHLAACGGYVECVKTLIGHGANVDQRDSQGWSPLLYADFMKNRSCVVAMLQPENTEVCAAQLKNLASLMQSDHGETIERVVKVVEYAATIPEFYEAINRLVQSDPEVLVGCMSFLLRNSSLLSYQSKVAWLMREVERSFTREIGFCWKGADCKLVVDRERMVESSIEALLSIDDESCRSRHFEVCFHGEEGTGTGPRREYFAVAPKKFVHEDLALFGQSSETRVYHPLAGDLSRKLHVKSSQEEQECMIVDGSSELRTAECGMHAFGRLLGLAIRHRHLVDVKFSRALLRMIVGGNLDFELLEEIEPKLYQSLCSLKQHGALDDMDLDFTITFDYRGAGHEQKGEGFKKSIELIKGGEQVKVTRKNIEKYTELYAQYKLRDAAKELTDKMLEGIFEVVPKAAIRIFSDQELDLLLCGLPKIDVDDWRKWSRYSGASKDQPLTEMSQLSVWFWEFVCSREEAERALLLKFCTGSSVPPSDGFENLPGLSSICRFTLACTQQDDDRLPTASTCFNLLKIPDYSSKEVLEERLHVALHYGSEGFSFS